MPTRAIPAAAAALALAAALLAAPAKFPEPEMLAPHPHPKGYVCYRTPSPVTVDGSLADPAWDAAPWTDAFVDIEGDKRVRPRHRTRVKMLWDDEALYIAAELEEPHVWATLAEHDAVIFQDDDFEVFLDPDGDNHLYAELELNAKNTTWDLLLTKPYKDGGHAVNGWEAIGLKTAVRVDGTLNDPRDTDRGWTVEVRWPFAGLKELTRRRVPPRDGDAWRVNFSRVDWDVEAADGRYTKVPNRPEHNWVWSPQGVVDMHRPERWGYLQFRTAKPGTAAYAPDPEWPARDLLHRVYYAQRRHHADRGSYAPAGALGLKDLPAGLAVEPRRAGFEASVPLPAGEGDKPRRLTITEDARIRAD